MSNRNGAVKQRTRCACIGPLASHISGFVAYLRQESYAPETVRAKRRLIVDISRWMQRLELPLVKLDEEQLREFQINRRRRHRLRPGDILTVRQLLQYLRDLGCIRMPREKTDRTSLGRMVRDFERYLSLECGLSQSTQVDYLRIVQCFLADCFGTKSPRLTALTQRDIHCFIITHHKDGGHSRVKKLITALRSFLHYLHQSKAIAIDLAAGVPRVANWRLSHLPRSLPVNQVRQLLASCNRSTPSGQRDYAILLLMSRLGLRAREVVNMTLDDLDWVCSELIVHGKGQQEDRLPLPPEVGAALVNYLRHARPVCSTRRVFIRMKAPWQGLKGGEAICRIVRAALKRADLNPQFKGSHVLRHSLATNLLRRGATLMEIGQLLRHRGLATTQIYAKVDIAALRAIALPWPRGAL
jgi:site-specific recombinase XerD